MNKILEKILTIVVDEGIYIVGDASIRAIDNYSKRRDVGFGIISSIEGSFQETKRYYNSVFSGYEPEESKALLIFDEKRRK